MTSSKSILFGNLLFSIGLATLMVSCWPQPVAHHVHELAPLVHPTTVILLSPEEKCEMSSQCAKLAEVGYFEARSESDEGVLATMFTVLNRVDHPHYPYTIHEVVHQPKQFSYTHDGSLERGIEEPEQFRRTLSLAYAVLTEEIESPIGDSTHYHTTAINPYWASSLTHVTTIGSHKFYSY